MPSLRPAGMKPQNKNSLWRIKQGSYSMSSGTQVRPESFASITETGFEAEAKRLVAGMHTPKPTIFWTDLGASVAVCWTAFAFALFLPAWNPAMLAAAALTTFAPYRAPCFIHQISHLP